VPRKTIKGQSLREIPRETRISFMGWNFWELGIRQRIITACGRNET
jgi:hypothetical protein